MVTSGQVLRYTLLPGIWPRLQQLFGSGFSSVAILLAYVFAAVRLLPYGHPYLNPQNARRFGIRHVLAEASSNLKFSRSNADQVVVFFTVLTGLVILVIQFVLLFMAFFTQPVVAQTFVTFGEVFNNPNTSQDLAFNLLDRVFGVKGIFNSCISTTETCLDINGQPGFTPPQYPYPIHIALHQMLGFYSMGIGIIALMVILYQVVNIVGETATSGTPFGQRFNKTWAPVRLILFFGLLAPLNIGQDNAWLNLAQIITLHTAKYGSNMASNGWTVYHKELTDGYLGDAQTLIAKPENPKFGYLMQFYTVMHACKEGYLRVREDENGNGDGLEVKGYIVEGMDSLEITSTSYQEALEFTRYGPIFVRYGVRDKENNPDYIDGIRPLCGEVRLEIGDLRQPGAQYLHEVYFEMLKGFEDGTNANAGAFAQIIQFETNCLANKYLKQDSDRCDPNYEQDLELYARTFNVFINANFEDIYEEAIKTQQDAGQEFYELPQGLKDKGWAAAAIFYNTIAEMNGAVTGAVLNLPTIVQYPEIMHKVEEANEASSETEFMAERFNPGTIGKKQAVFERKNDEDMARLMYESFKIFQDYNVDVTQFNKMSGNAAIDTINALLGTQGIYSIRENANINPLAQLSALGRGMVNQAIRNFGAAIGISIGGGIPAILPNEKEPISKVADFFKIFATVGILIGFILYYVLPFMPFIYFFFALGGWVKSIFEAMVAMPLWALAHLTIDGEGLPGQAASSGYYLLFEIFVRPILMLVGLFASILTFSAMVQVLNDIFDIVVVNVAGNNPENPTPDEIEYYRSTLDEFFYTVIYTVIVYMIGTASFKMIDMVPDKILRWMGISTPTIQESDKNAAEQLVGSIYRGSQLQLGQLQGGQIASMLR